MSQYDKSTIIGLWRMGATALCISINTGWMEAKVKRVISDYKTHINE